MIEFNRYNYGLGATVDVSALAAAIDAGRIHPTFTQNYCTPNWTTGLPPQALGPYDYVDSTSAGQIASLLGASVVQAPPSNINCSPIPLANFIQFPDGTRIPAGPIAQQIPVNAGDPNSNPANNTADRLMSTINYQIQNQQSEHAQEPSVPVTPVNTPTTTPVIPTPVLPVTPVTLPGGTTPVVNSGGSASTGTLVVNSGGATTGNSSTGSGTTTDWSAWFKQTSVGSIPNWALVAGAVVALFLFTPEIGGGRR